MARTRATAVSAMVLALALTGVGVLPFVGASAMASATALDPVEPCDAGQCPTQPETTITITTTLPTPTPTPEQPETTITRTVTAKPTKKTQAPKPSRTRSAAVPDTPETSQSAAPPPQQVPTQSPQEVPEVAATTPEESVQMPTVAGTETPTPPITTDPASVESEAVQWEVRNAAPEYDQRSLTQRLSIPALIMVLLALFAVLIFEGRLRRMAHAAAVRKAGPQAGASLGAFPHHPGPAEGYPAGPGYATAGVAAPGYPGGTAYAPIISFVPVQTFPTGQVQYGAVYHDPNATHVAHGPVAEPPPAQEPVVLPPDQFDSYSHEPPEQERQEFRAPFEPLVPPEPPPSDIPPGGAGPYEDAPDRPLGPASAAEPGDSEPWGGSLRQPPQDRTVEQRFPEAGDGPDDDDRWRPFR
ncbi:hypothetical protein ACQEUU_30880 [Nonomuraea sp. CA-218870]|uniref:hypothetical protein n=1 Tax=Nonomuraea sp. CA-218870 TaxID=3239998 RepID=UPI003D933460